MKIILTEIRFFCLVNSGNDANTFAKFTRFSDKLVLIDKILV